MADGWNVSDSATRRTALADLGTCRSSATREISRTSRPRRSLCLRFITTEALKVRSPPCSLAETRLLNHFSPGVSLITQVLYAVVFCTRYIDIFYETIRWNFFFKVFYISSSLYIIAIMQWVFPRTREREISWKIGAFILAGSLLISPFTMLIFEKWWSFSQWLWDFSEILEAVCVLPQLVLLRQTSVPTVINSFYLITLGLYRLLYVMNWIWRGVDPTSRSPNAVSVIFGVIQTALFVDFFWVCLFPAP